MKWANGIPNANLSLGYCKGDGTTRQQGLYRDYLELAAVIEAAGISDKHATKFVDAVKAITHRHGFNVSFPTDYRNLKRSVMKQVEYRLLPIKCDLIAYPEAMFDSWATMKRMRLVYVDLMLVVSDIMSHVAKTGIYVICNI
jgi:hypothetical protein